MIVLRMAAATIEQVANPLPLAGIARDFGTKVAS